MPLRSGTVNDTNDLSGDEAGPVTLRSHGDVAVITLDDGKANALSPVVVAGLDAALDGAADARAVAIIGRPGKFSAGFDLSVMTSGPDEARRLLSQGAELGLRLFTLPIPVTLGVTGHALAMGAILLTCADYRVGAEGAYKLGLNEVAIGMPVPTFGTELCRDRLSPLWFTRCVQLAEILNPLNAVAAGFLDEVVEAPQVAARTISVATQLAATVHSDPFARTRRNCRHKLAEELRIGLASDMALFEVTTP